jgi:DNA-binding transcriptional LysR family regulator
VIDLGLLHSFVAVAETEHVGRAAVRLHISQSPLSRQIQKLEAELGLRLFDRDRRRIRLTDAGRWLLAEGRELLGRAARVEQDAARAARGESGRLAIGFVKSALWSGVMPSALRRFQRSRPYVKLELRALGSELQAEGVRSGELDVGLLHRGSDHADVVCVHLFDEPFVLALPARHRLTRLAAIRPKDLGGEPWVGLLRALYPASHARFAELGRRAGFVPEVRHETGDRATALSLVESGLGIALLPASARRVSAPGVTFRELPWLSMATSISLIHRPLPTAAAKHFADLAIAGARRARVS